MTNQTAAVRQGGRVEVAAATPPVPKFVREVYKLDDQGFAYVENDVVPRGWRPRLGKAPLCALRARFTWARRHHLNEPTTLRPLIGCLSELATDLDVH